MRTGWEIRSRHWHWLETLIEKPDKISCSDVLNGWFQEQSKTKELGWSAKYHKLGWQSLHVDSKQPRSITRIFVFLLCIYL